MVLEQASLPEWISAISQLLLVLIFVALFTGANQRIQVYLWSRDIRSKLVILESFANDARRRAVEYMVSKGAKDAESLVSRLADFFVISPVDIEPVDIIRRLEHLVNLRSRRFKEEVARHMPEADEVSRSKAEVALEIASALSFIHKYVRHILLTGEKTRNWILIMQLQLIMPMILKIADTYRRALNDFLKGVPIGDSAGPMVALRLAGRGARWERIEEETVYTVADVEGRRVYIVKAEGPGSSVGRPGSATERLIEKLVAQGMKPRLLVTVDAALKLEGEETGSVADGVGAAIGDIGPEKIRFERIAVKYGIALRAVAIKMGLEEAILGMTEKIVKGVEKAVERVKDIIRGESKPGDIVVVVGVGNTVGVGQ
ncbi:DUF1512 domain-containing protein [Aeropyrum pernix]|uniref:DUF1512 domain-containing protein n=1 Tax=Aeropyrum pernix TaxID=56636 RepID=UPI0010372151|nr:DUF1512 domain-containing protein [Aeropyrum pernix]